MWFSILWWVLFIAQFGTFLDVNPFFPVLNRDSIWMEVF